MGMLGRRVAVTTLAIALLAGCATNPDGSYDDRNCLPQKTELTPGNNNPLVDLAAVLLVDITWFAGCEAIVGVANGIHNFHRASTHEGVYYSPDGLFSVAVPGEPGADAYQVQQQIEHDKDTVVFVPPTPDSPAYGITALPHLQDADAALSLDAFAEQASAKLPGVGDQVGSTLKQIHAEDVQVGANPARFLVYRSASGPESYYLLYFIKTTHTAAILSVTWPRQCPRCAGSSETNLREMDPDLQAFVTSFELASKGR
jgi:hypothetical protein